MINLTECLDCAEMWATNDIYCPECDSPNIDWADNVENELAGVA